MDQKKNWRDTLAQYPEDQYNVQILEEVRAAITNLHKTEFYTVELDARVDADGQPIGRDIKRRRSDGKYTISKVGALKLAQAANISIVTSREILPTVCKRCKDLGKIIGDKGPCGECDARYNASFTVVLHVPDLQGGFKSSAWTDEYDYCTEKARIKDKSTGPFPYRREITEAKAFLKGICEILGLQYAYTLEEISKPFVVARVIPDLDNPQMQRQVDQCCLSDMGAMIEKVARSAM
ncbi:hypothetical protein FACS1894184_19360 [Clostridia bacterium]|nr:hypothetical protein FACS1894184_19360 [Clostridia bacterium]